MTTTDGAQRPLAVRAGLHRPAGSQGPSRRRGGRGGPGRAPSGSVRTPACRCTTSRSSEAAEAHAAVEGSVVGKVLIDVVTVMATRTGRRTGDPAVRRRAGRARRAAGDRRVVPAVDQHRHRGRRHHLDHRLGRDHRQQLDRRHEPQRGAGRRRYLPARPDRGDLRGDRGDRRDRDRVACPTARGRTGSLHRCSCCADWCWPAGGCTAASIPATPGSSRPVRRPPGWGRCSPRRAACSRSWLRWGSSPGQIDPPAPPAGRRGIQPGA